MTTLAHYLVEVEQPRTGWAQLQGLTARARAAAAEMRGDGAAVRFLRSIFVPEDDSCFFLYEADSRDLVCRAAAAAGVALGPFASTLAPASEVVQESRQCE